MIDGDPGAGKTTFIKRLCYIWAQSVLHPEERDTEDEYLHKYTLVIPIILRLISMQNTLIDLFTSQLQCLNICQVCALVRILESEPNKLLLLLDGYDEYIGQSIISKVITKEECPKILTVTTSRPHAIEQLRRHTSQAVDQEIRLSGFTKEQVKQYITQFCEYHELPREKGEALIKTLSDERPDILEVAKIPIRTEMVCIVWAEYGELGETLADLYEKFVTHSITHWKTKQKTKQGLKIEKMSKQQVIKQSEPVLIKIGQLANTWEKYNRLRIVFSTEELQEILGEDFDEVINIGILIKSHPSSILQESKWSFPHLTIQEYFVSYFLANTADRHVLDEFASRCKEFKILQRCEVIFMFLCSKFPDVANKILTWLVRQEKDENKCTDLLDIIIKLIQYYENRKIDIPLPYCVDIKPIDRHINRQFSQDKGQLIRSSLYSLLESEKSQNKPNLHSLTVCDILQYRDFMDLTYLQRMDVQVRSKEELLMLKQKIQHMKALETLSVQSDVSFTDVDLVSSVPTNNLIYLSLTGPDVMKAAADHIQKFTILQQLHIDEESTNYTEETRNKLISSLNSNKNIKKVSLWVTDLYYRILQEKLNMEVILQVKYETLRKDSLRKAVNGLNFTEGLHQLVLINNNLKDEGESLGQLMTRMTTLRVLDVYGCYIKGDTVQAMVQTIKEIKVTSGLHALYMGRYGYHNNSNKLHTGGRYLGELVNLIPDLNTLDLDDCNLTDPDLVKMSDAVPVTTNIHTLNLQHNNVGYNIEGLVSLMSHTPHLQALAIGGPYNTPDPVPAVCRVADAGSLTSLHVLDMSFSQLQPESLEKLGQHLQYMNSLQVINLAYIEGVKYEDYQHVCSNLPPSLQHLNVYTRHDIKLDVSLILDNQHHLNHLHRLNVRLEDSDIELLQEILEQNNPDIHMYSNVEEDTWRMSVKVFQFQGQFDFEYQCHGHQFSNVEAKY